MKVIKGFIISFSMYSRIPMPQFEWKEEDMRYAMCFFPWVGAVIGLIFYGWYILCRRLSVGSMCFALISAAIPVIVTGGFHVDGYMDTMDAFNSYQSRERKLEILKDSHIGAFAAIMLAAYYLIYVAAFTELHDKKAVFVVAVSFFISRCFSGISVVTFKSAKNDGLLYTFASSSHKMIVRCSLYIQLLAAFMLSLYISIPYGIIMAAAQVLSFVYYRVRCYKEFGGITGDTAGFFVTVCEASVTAAVAVTEMLLRYWC